MELCTHLSYSRSISPGKAVFFYKTSTSDFVPLRVDVTKISGQKCSYSEGLDTHANPRNVAGYELAYSNPQTIETCYIPPNVDNLYCRFSLRIEANSMQPRVCSEPYVFNTMVRLAQAFLAHGGYDELAQRYSRNLLMGTWLWRNRATRGTHIEIRTSHGSLYAIPDARKLSWSANWPALEQQLLGRLATEVATALSQPQTFWFADVTATLKTSFCQEIFPSQKFIERSDNYLVASRQLATTECVDGQLAACINPQKIGAAIQAIDDWWADDADIPLRVHEYGAHREVLTAHRHPSSGQDFYHLLLRADELLSELQSDPGKHQMLSRDLLFLMAVLVKGGLFQKGKSK